MRKSSINELTAKDIKDAINHFKNAALRAEKSGYDGVQIHGAHNWFLSRFISPLNNQRTDEYGGSPKKRAKILADILHAMRQVVSEDFMEGGLTVEDSLVACELLSDAGIDAIEVSENYTRYIWESKNKYIL